MAVTASTTLSATSYTAKAVSAEATVNEASDGTGGDPLKIKSAPDSTSTVNWHNCPSSPYSNKNWTVYEIHSYTYNGVYQWCREWFNGSECYSGYKSNSGGGGIPNRTYVNLSTTPVASYGQIRISGGTVSASRENNASPTVTLTWSINYQIAQAPIESYKNWQVYLYAQTPSGSETQAYLYNRSKSWSTGSGTKTITMSFSETSGNTTVSCKAGVHGNGTGNYNSSYNGGVSNIYTINIPKYVSSPVKKYNGSSWVTVPVKKYNGSSWDPVYVKKYNGSSWTTL